jgi:hypothetical protein
MYLHCAVTLALLATLTSADNPNSAYAAPAASSSYAAPAASYGAPAASYAAPAASYGAPAASYGAPAPSYGAPAASSGYAAPDAGYGAPTGGSSYAAPSYDAPAYDYGYAPPATSGFDLGALASIAIPILIAIAAIIAAIIIGGFLLSLLLGAGALNLNFLAPFINFILSPLGLTLCSVGPPLAPFPPPGRMFADVAEEYGLSLTDDQIATVSELAESAISAIKSKLSVHDFLPYWFKKNSYITVDCSHHKIIFIFIFQAISTKRAQEPVSFDLGTK